MIISFQSEGLMEGDSQVFDPTIYYRTKKKGSEWKNPACSFE